MSVKEKLIKKINAIENKFPKSKNGNDKFYGEILSDLDKIKAMIVGLEKIDFSTEAGLDKSDKIINVVGGQIAQTSNKVLEFAGKQSNGLDETLINTYNELENLHHELYAYLIESARQFQQEVDASQPTNE